MFLLWRLPSGCYGPKHLSVNKMKCFNQRKVLNERFKVSVVIRSFADVNEGSVARLI
jgi:hypothetical protein